MKLTDFQTLVQDACRSTKGAGKFAAESALRHLNRACSLTSTMPEVAIFLAITAEEEATSAIYHSLKKKRYKGSERLNIRDHRHKSALTPFLDAVKEAYRPLLEIAVLQIGFEDETPEKIKAWLVLKLESGQYVTIEPSPPLGFINVPKGGSEKEFIEQMAKVANSTGHKNMLAYIKHLASIRNSVLYASPNKIPRAENADEFVLEKLSTAFTLLATYLLIEQYRGRQPLAQRALDSLLEILPNT